MSGFFHLPLFQTHPAVPEPHSLHVWVLFQCTGGHHFPVCPWVDTWAVSTLVAIMCEAAVDVHV